MPLPPGFELEQSSNLPPGFILDRRAPSVQAPTPGSESLPSLGERMRSMGDAAARGFVMGGPVGVIAGTGGEAMRQIGQAMDRGAYRAGGAVTDVLSPHVPPEVAAGAGYVTNVGVQALPVVAGALAGRAADPKITAPFRWAGEKIRNIADPWLPGGVDRAVGRTALETAGPKAPSVMQYMKENRQIVPGSLPNAGEAAAPAGSAEFSGLQRVVEGRQPSAYFARATEQENARAAALRAIGKTPADVTAAEASRAAITGPMRSEVFEATRPVGVSTQRLMRQIRGVESQPGIRASDVVSKTMSEVKDKIKNFTKEGFINTKDLYTIRKELGNTIQKNAKETANWDKRLSAGLERDLQSYIDDAIEAAGGSGWKNYLSTYREMSRPINQMRVGQELERSLTAPLGATERPAAFAQALRNAPQTIKRASTGQSRYQSLDEVFDPKQVQGTTNVLDDLERAALHEQLAKAGTEKARDIVGQVSPALPAAGMFNPKYSVLRAISNRLAGRIEGKSLERMSEAMQDPPLIARLMEEAARRKALARVLSNRREFGTTLGAGIGAGFGYEAGKSP